MRKIFINANKLKIIQVKGPLYIINAHVNVDRAVSFHVQIITPSENLITRKGLAQKIGYELLKELNDLSDDYPDPEPKAVTLFSWEPITLNMWEKNKIKDVPVRYTNTNSNVIKFDEIK